MCNVSTTIWVSNWLFHHSVGFASCISLNDTPSHHPSHFSSPAPLPTPQLSGPIPASAHTPACRTFEQYPMNQSNADLMADQSENRKADSMLAFALPSRRPMSSGKDVIRAAVRF